MTVNELARHAAQEEMPLLTACMDMPESLNARARKAWRNSANWLMMSLTMMQVTMKLTELVQYVIDTVGAGNDITKTTMKTVPAWTEHSREFVSARSRG